MSVLVGETAHLRFASVQDWDAGAVHVVQVASRLGRDATLHSTQVSLGGDLVRVTESVDYTGTGADATLNGVYFADAGQHLEHRLFVDHAVPHCRSNVTYKGALQGDGAHTVWVGDVLIRAAAEGTDTYELNRNLVLTDGARADSVPNLEIETGEIVAPAMPAPPAGSTTSSCSTCRLGGSPRARRVGSSCAGSSPSSSSASACRRSRSA